MQTIGQKLKEAREAKHITLEKVFEATRIRMPYLQALEADDLSSMPSPVQARGYLRNYAEFLGLNFDQLLDDMRAASKPSDEMIAPVDSTPAPATPAPQVPPQEATNPSPSKPARRKKADSKPATDSSPSKPTRRKKA
ncbi:MAG: helix-turn-helix domain-containing protein, partial [Anaerolineales bacterium]|nr:helix-turn-helix domain-containing protein [Anaerolineales bacterium]